MGRSANNNMSGLTHGSGEHISVENEILDCLKLWADRIGKGTAEEVTALYAPGAVLLATFDPTPLTTPESNQNYFANLKARAGLNAIIDEYRIETYGSMGGVINGLYTFRFLDEAGAQQAIAARYTLAYKRDKDGVLKIISHHSSKSPERQGQSAAQARVRDISTSVN